MFWKSRAERFKILYTWRVIYYVIFFDNFHLILFICMLALQEIHRIVFEY